ncbi:MAG: hypothetical protein ACPG5P_01520 [Saprospiraceae bacterium]
MRYAFALCIILSIFGCNKKTSTATGETATKMSEKNSEDKPMSTAEIVKAIADSGQVESSHIGIAAIPSKQHNRFIDLRDNTSNEELKKLLEHKDRIVKYYAFRALRENGDMKLKTYYKQMADDQGTVTVLNGDVMTEVSLPMLLKQEMAKGGARSEKAEKRVPNNPNK